MKPWMRWSLWIILIVGAVFGVFRYFFIDFHVVPDDPNDPRSWANSPNLEPGDQVLVWRGDPHIGDLVRCPDPSDPAKWLVARVIGTAGDRIEFVDGILRINGFRVTTGGCQGSARKVVDPSGAEQDMICWHEELGGSKHDLQANPNGAGFPNQEWKVEQGKLFLMSDTRTQPWAHDSREPEVGQLDVESCKQRLIIRLMSKKGWGDAERRMTFLF